MLPAFTVYRGQRRTLFPARVLTPFIGIRNSPEPASGLPESNSHTYVNRDTVVSWIVTFPDRHFPGKMITEWLSLMTVDAKVESCIFLI